MHQLPDYNSLTDKELRYRNRHVDLLMNRGVRDVFLTRSKVINSLRSFLDNRGFVEVETPMLQKHPGGAIAKPFETYLHAHHAKLYMRIAPELYLKQLIVGGIERVYEIGKQFRNEGVDLTHNPEFTTCEFYQAYSDYNQLMTTTEELLRHIIFSVTGGYSLKVDIPRKKGHPELGNESVELDFSKPFRRIFIEEDLAKCLNVEKLPDVNDPNSVTEFLELCRRHNIEVETPHTSVKLLDNLVEHFLESQCTQPTFLCHQPLATSPLARQHRSIGGVTERFELFAGRMELCNAYTELNDPEEQRKRFAHQVALGESLGFNEEWFCQVLEWGLPPTGGWGMGIDRLVMLITGRFAIKEVLLFPFMKDQVQNPAPAQKEQPKN
jgi:lysyl-tRNA synthetase, class II